MAFNLWERSLTINVKNLWLKHPENTIFHVKDYKWEDVYKWTYFLSDIKSLDKWELDLSFNNMHCKYNIKLNINPNMYQKNIDITFKQNTKLQCNLDIKPENIKNTMTISTKNIDKTVYDISLNDLSFRHYLWIFLFWLFVIIALMIKYIDKKWLLLNNTK